MRAGFNAQALAHAAMSASAPNLRVASTPSAFISAQSRGVLEKKLGGSSRLRSRSSSRVASTYPMSAALKQGKPWRLVCSRILSAPQMSTTGGFVRPDAAQCTMSEFGASETEPC